MLDVKDVIRLLSKEWTEWNWQSGDKCWVVKKGSDAQPRVLVCILSETVVRAWSSNTNLGGDDLSSSHPSSSYFSSSHHYDDWIDIDFHDPESLLKLKQFLAQNLA